MTILSARLFTLGHPLGLGNWLQNDGELAMKRESHLNRNCGCADNGSKENAGQWTGSEMSMARQVPISQRLRAVCGTLAGEKRC
jgi:hypothetical protein